MATSTIRELLVKLGVEADTKAVEAFDASVDSAKEHLQNLVDVAETATAVLAALVGALVYQAVETAGTAATIEDQAAALGISTDAYQELTYAAEKAGGSSEDVVKTLSKLNVAAEEAASGNEAAAGALAAVGVSADDLANASPEEALAMVADGLASIEDPAARAAAATALLGDDLAVKMLPVLSGGAEGLAAVAEEAQNLGIVLDGDALDAAAAFDDQLDQLGALFDALRNEIGLAIIPVLSDLVSGFMEWVEANREAISTGIEEWVGLVGDGLTFLAEALSAANEAVGGADGWKTLAEVFAALGAAGGIAYVVVQVVSLASAIWGAVSAAAAVVGGFAALASGVGIVAGLIAYVIGLWTTLGLLVQDFYTYLTGGDSVFGRLIERFQEAGGGLAALGNLMQAFGSLASAVLSRVGQGWDFLVSLIDPAIAKVTEFAGVIEGYLVAALDKVQPLLDLAAQGVSALAGLIGTAPGTTSTAGAGTYASSAGSTSSTTSSTTAATSSYAPTATAATSTGAAAPVTQTVNSGGLTVNGNIGYTLDEVKAVYEELRDADARAASASFAGGEV